MHEEALTRLLDIQGFRVTRVEVEPRGERPASMVPLDRTTPNSGCGRCQQPVGAAYDRWEQEAQPLPLWKPLTFLRFRRVRVAGPPWGVVPEALIHFASLDVLYYRHPASLLVGGRREGALWRRIFAPPWARLTAT